MTHTGGPILGDITSSSVKVWLRTLKPATVEVQIEGLSNSNSNVQTTIASDLAGVVSIKDLKPLTTYKYKVLIDGEEIKIPEHARITTTPVETARDHTRIAFGADTHRWGLGNNKQSAMIRSRNPHALLLNGDIAVQDRNDHIGLHRADFFLRDLFPAWQDLAATVPIYTAWDDHDYFDDDLGGIPEGYDAKDRQNVWHVFTQSWPNPAFGFGENGQGVHFHSRIGCCDFIQLDNRYFRDNENEGKRHSFIGEEQFEWFKEQLLSCEGEFIIVACGTMWSDYVSDGKDSWGYWDPEIREEIFQFIEDNSIKGVLLISGDRHGARGFRIPRESGFDFYEFEIGSLGGRSGPAVTKPEWITQLYGIEREYAFGEFLFDTTKQDPTVTFRLIHEDGHSIYDTTLTRSQLTPS